MGVCVVCFAVTSCVGVDLFQQSNEVLIRMQIGLGSD